MEDKQYLDEAGLGEVGKVISKFYASKDDIKDLDSLKKFVDSHNEIKLHYITQEEYQKMDDEGKLPQLSDIHDPIAIVGIEHHADEYVTWNNPPCGDYQHYLLFNITPNQKLTSDKIDSFDFNGVALKDSDVRLQLALGEKDQCLYWRLLNSKEDYTKWVLIKDSSSTEIAKSAHTRVDVLFLLIKNKVDKVQNKQLSTNDYTNEDKKKLDSINIEEIKSLTQRVEALESKMH